MRRAVFGKIVYDTTTARKVCVLKREEDDWDYLDLMQTPEGRFFVHDGGGMWHESVTPTPLNTAIVHMLQSDMSKDEILSTLRHSSTPLKDQND